jgi:hypothetical protein
VGAQREKIAKAINQGCRSDVNLASILDFYKVAQNQIMALTIQ